MKTLLNTPHLIRIAIIFTAIWGLSNHPASAQINGITSLPTYTHTPTVREDWLVTPVSQKTGVFQTADQQLALSNGLITRTFSLHPGGATVGLDNLVTGQALLRSVSPEAILWVNGHEIKVGGLIGQPVQNYLDPAWIPQMEADPLALKLVSWDTQPLEERIDWKPRTEWLSKPPKAATGTTLTFSYQADEATLQRQPEHQTGNMDFLRDLVVHVHYAIYEGIPLIGKWVTVEYNGEGEVIVNNIRTEHLAVTEAESAVDPKQRWELPPIFAQSDFAFGSMSPNASENAGVEWRADSTYTTQVNYLLKTPTVLVCEPKHGVGQEISRGKPFESMRLWELLYDRSDRERRGLAQRKMYRTLAPWTQENPIIMHVRNADDASVKKAIDQSAEVGFEMVIMTFGSGFNLEDTTAANLQRMKSLADYAHHKGIALGGYSLLASRSIDADNDVIMPPGMTPTFGHSPCLLSEWGDRYFHTLYHFYEKTEMDMLEHDGSYPGDVCASDSHPGHHGLEDSQWKQFVRIRDFYRWSRAKGIYLNVPDWYFLEGSTKTGMGYREANWSLPREYQEIIERQNIYDGTWEKTPSMGWMFVPLVEYQGGGAAATIEPLHEHLPHYEQRLANLFGAGVQACYRGPQLYDTPETKTLVKKWVDFYKNHRRILDSDMVHLRRPDGRDYDGVLHVDPTGEEKGLLMLYNPLDTPIDRTLTVDLYYTGLTDQAIVSENDGSGKKMPLHGTVVQLPVHIPANGQVWYTFK